MRKRIGHFQPTILSLATAYDDQSGQNDELVIPESFEGMEYAALQELFTNATAAFDAMYAEEDRSPERNEQLGALTDGIEALAAELARRDAVQAERDSEAEGFAERVAALRAGTNDDAADDEGEDDAEGDEPADEVETENEGDEEEAPASEDEGAAEVVTASGSTRARSEVRVPLSGVRRTAAAATQTADEAPTMRDVAVSAGEGTGFAVGAGMDFLDIGRAIDRKLQGYNASQYKSAHKMGRQVKEQHGIVAFQRKFDDDLMVTSNDREHVDAVIARAVDESRLPGGALTAAGGWCAPSEALYDLLELESRDGMLSIPEIGISRGGIQFTTGPSFAGIYSEITGFSFTEDEDIDGKYEPGENGNVVGPKPCYKVDCPDFTEVRLDVDGLCIQAGLLQSRGYPEVIARTVRGALVAHEHRMNAKLIAKMVAGSTAVSMGTQAGAIAPILDSIEKQTEHYRYTHRLSRGTTLEAVFPFWVRGAVRSDLSRRLGVELLDVADARIDGWFRSRGINPQFVYNWQAIDVTAANAFNAWPSTVSFLLYAAGTWVRGANDIITVDTLYDSTLLSNNDYTALFTEEGWLVAKRGFDSRVVTVGICPDGATHEGIGIECNGTATPAAVVPGSAEENPLFTREVSAG